MWTTRQGLAISSLSARSPNKKPRELSWKSVAGDVERISGTYRFTKIDEDHTEASCRQVIDLGFWMPGPLRRLAEATALEQSVGEFKAEAERRAKLAKRGSK